ncbi:MAG: DUF819 family protein [Bacteroidota bacterium]
MGFLWLAVLILLPIGLYILTKWVKLFELFGVVVLGYVAGMVLGNIPGLKVHPGAAEIATSGAIVLALPMLLFKVDFLGWLKTAGTAVGAYAIAVLSVLVMACSAYLIFEANLNRAMLSGMFTGAATGGTVNLNSVALAARAPDELVLRANFVDIIAGGVYLLVLMGPGKFVLRKWLGKPKDSDAFDRQSDTKEAGAEAKLALVDRLKQGLMNTGIAILIALATFIAASGLTELLYPSGDNIDLTGDATAHPNFLPIFMLMLTTAGIVLSFLPKIRVLPFIDETAEYLLVIFALALGSQVNFSAFKTSNLDIMAYGLTIIYGSIVLHYLLCKLFRIDADSAIMASGAAILSPPLLPPIAKVLGNKQALISGLTTGMVGYATGTYLGVLLVELLPGVFG